MAYGFTKTQFDSFNEPFSTFLPPPTLPTSAPLSTLQPCNPTPSELSPQPISASTSSRPYAPSPSVETIEEVEKQIYNALRNTRQMRNKLEASSRKMPTSRLLFDEICIERSTTFGGSNMRFYPDKNLDAWYTNVLGFSLAVIDPARAQLALA